MDQDGYDHLRASADEAVMTEPLTPEEEAGLRGRHYAFENDERSIVCHEDARGWPCGTARLLATLDAARTATPAAPPEGHEDRQALWDKFTGGEKLAYGVGYRDAQSEAATPAAPDLPGDYIETEPGSATPAAPHRDDCPWPHSPCNCGAATPAAPEAHLARARDLIANYLWNEDGEDEEWLVEAHDILNGATFGVPDTFGATPADPEAHPHPCEHCDRTVDYWMNRALAAEATPAAPEAHPCLWPEFACELGATLIREGKSPLGVIPSPAAPEALTVLRLALANYDEDRTNDLAAQGVIGAARALAASPAPAAPEALREAAREVIRVWDDHDPEHGIQAHTHAGLAALDALRAALAASPAPVAAEGLDALRHAIDPRSDD